MNQQTIVMLERVKFLTLRIRKILEGSKICVIEADNESTLFNSFSSASENPGLILMDLDIDSKYAMDLLIETKKRVKSTPIVIMTGENKKKFFIEALLQGATDFIIKPFTNQVFMEKIQKYLSASGMMNNEIISMDLSQYISGELRKAEKGNFPLSLMFMYFQSNTPNATDHQMNNLIFNNMKTLFWDTDLFIRFAYEHSVGIFPFCDEKNKEILHHKIITKFEELKTEYEQLKDYEMLCAFVSYPHDTDKKEEVYKMFIDRINSEFQGLNLNSDQN